MHLPNESEKEKNRIKETEGKQKKIYKHNLNVDLTLANRMITIFTMKYIVFNITTHHYTIHSQHHHSLLYAFFVYQTKLIE